MGISGKKEDTSKVLRFVILWKHPTENGFDMFSEYVANSTENLGNRVCHMSTLLETFF